MPRSSPYVITLTPKERSTLEARARQDRSRRGRPSAFPPQVVAEVLFGEVVKKISIVAQVMSQEPYRSARRVFRIVAEYCLPPADLDPRVFPARKPASDPLRTKS